MNAKTIYARKISTQEAREGYIMVLKNRLSFFPHLGKPFQLKSETSAKKAAVESYRCSCQGPDLPHEHFFIRWDGLKKGMTVSIQMTKNEGEYSLKM